MEDEVGVEAPLKVISELKGPLDWEMDGNLKQEHIGRAEHILNGKSGRSAARVLARMNIPMFFKRIEDILVGDTYNRTPGWVARRIFVELERILMGEEAKPEELAPRRTPGQLEE